LTNLSLGKGGGAGNSAEKRGRDIEGGSFSLRISFFGFPFLDGTFRQTLFAGSEVLARSLFRFFLSLENFSRREALLPGEKHAVLPSSLEDSLKNEQVKLERAKRSACKDSPSVQV